MTAPAIVRLDAPGRLALAAALGESPATIMSCHRLRRGLATAWALGDPAAPVAAIVQGTLLPADPHAHGEDPAAIRELLRVVPGWSCVNAPEAVAAPLARLVERDAGSPCDGGPEIYSLQTTPADLPPHPVARRLHPDHLPLLLAATGPLGMAGWRFGSAAALLEEGIAAGIVVDGDLLAVAFTSALGTTHAEVGIVTRGDARGRGYATASAAIVCAALHASGILPVWSTSPDNLPSRRVAAHLGFRDVSQRQYICRPQAAGSITPAPVPG